MLEAARIKFIAEDALLIEFGEVLDEALHQRVLMLEAALRGSSLAAHIETLPTFRSLMIKFDVFEISHAALLESVTSLGAAQVCLNAQTWRVPVCLEKRYAEDLSEVADILNMPETQIMRKVLKNPLQVYMYGFAPGFAYLGGLDAELHIPRRATPRPPMPPGALMIAGGLASLASVSMPTGWYVIGQTPLNMFSLQRKSLVPFFIGDMLQLYRIGVKEFEHLQSQPDMAGVQRIS